MKIKKYKTFYEMMENLCDRKFLIKYYLKFRFFKNIIHVEAYQELCRIYLDEYQEDRNLFFENRWLRKQ